MKKYILGILLVFLISVFPINAENYGKINTRDEKIQAIDKEIEALLKKKADLELLKKRINESNIDIEKPISKEYRPKIALVLSGGGAKGAAHIGVLKALEKYKVPVDYIVGTSIGSIIGAMYSVGYTPEEIEKLVLNLDFINLFSSTDDRNLKDVYEKVAYAERPLKITINKHNEINFPKGLVDGEHIYLEFKKIFDRASHIENFDDFPIPYRAVTTDLNTGKEVVLKSGDLAKSTLMSMAIPSVIVPIENQGKYFVDGGVINNFPISEAIKEEADIIIAVDITADSEAITDKSHIVSIVNKVATYQGDEKTQVQKKYADILVVPPVKKHNTLDFGALPALIKEGEKSGEQFAHVFKNISNEEKYNEQRARAAALSKRTVQINNINLKGTEVLKPEIVESFKPKKENMTVDDINLWVREIYNLSYVDRVFYRIDGDTITFDVKEDNGYKIMAGIGYVSDYGVISNIDVDIPRMNKYNQNYTLNLELSEYPKVSLKNKMTFGVGDYQFIGGYGASYGVSPVFFYRDGDKVSSYNSNVFSTQIDIGTSLFRDYLIGMSIGYKNVHSNYESGERKTFDSKTIENYLWSSWYILYDSMDKAYFPSKGFYSNIIGSSGKTLDNNNKEFNGYSYKLEGALPITRHFSIGSFLKGGKVDISNIGKSYEEMFKIGGVRDTNAGFRTIGFYGLPYTGIITDEFLVGGLSLQYEFSRNLYLLGKYNFITYNSENFFYQEDNDFSDDYSDGYGVGIGWNTFLGPIEAVFTNNVEDNGVLFSIFFGYTL